MHSFKRGILSFGVMVGFAVAAFASAPAGKTGDAADALQRLKEGNGRFVSGEVTHPRQDGARRSETAGGQHPFAIILTCADSRVGPEIFFDQGIGDLFVIRNAGNVIDDHVLGTIEYGVEHLHTPLIVVVGHSKCGAVAASVAGGEFPGHIGSIVKSIAPSVPAGAGAADPVDAVVRANAKHMAEQIAASKPIIAKAVEEGHVRVVAARYDIATGKVEFFESAAGGH